MDGLKGGKGGVGWTITATDQSRCSTYDSCLTDSSIMKTGERKVGLGGDGGGVTFLNHYLGALYIAHWVFFTYTSNFHFTILKLIFYSFS